VVIYGAAGNGKRQPVNELLIDDRWPVPGFVDTILS
jgi:hypothetical protein